MRLILHIGTEKTGTTAVQNFLYQNRQCLLTHRIGLLSSIESPNNRKLCAYCLPEDTFDDYFWNLNIRDRASRNAHFSGFESAFIEEVRSLKGQVDTVVISSEHFHSRLKTKASIQKLHRLLAPLFEEIRVICYFREQGDVIKSLYSTAMKNGHTSTLEQFIETCYRNEHYFKYDQFLDKWAAEFGGQNIHARLFTRHNLAGGDIRRDFIHLIDEQLTHTPMNYAGKTDNPSLGLTGLRLARWSNIINPRYHANGKLSFRSRLCLKLIESIPISYFGKLKFTHADEIKAIYQDSNRNFAEKYLKNPGNPFS